MTDTQGLLSAILAVQAEVGTLPKDATNPHFKSRYTPLDTIVEKVGPVINKHGLVWMTLPVRDDNGEPALTYRLAHAASGEVLEGTMPLLLAKRDAQGLGSAITYARRYSLCSVLNLVADDDDDGNGARRPAGATSDPYTAPVGAITEKQRGFLESLIRKATNDGMTKTSLEAIVSQYDVEVKPGWIGALSASTASALIETFKKGVMADPSIGSDIPTDDPPVVPEVGDESDLPFAEVDDAEAGKGA